jgi:hypothetical protein
MVAVILIHLEIPQLGDVGPLEFPGADRLTVEPGDQIEAVACLLASECCPGIVAACRFTSRNRGQVTFFATTDDRLVHHSQPLTSYNPQPAK